MNVQLSRLVTSAEIDASRYKVGADQKVAADRAMVASAQAVGQAASATDTKISQAGDSLARLSRQYVEGYAAAQRMQSAVNSLSRGIDAGKITMAQAEPILEGIFRKYGQIGDGAQFAAKGQHEFAAAITNTTARLSAQVVAANAAAAAASRVSVAANQNRVQPALQQGNFNSANVAAQFQDIAVTSAMGMSPLQIALQQGTQLSAVLGPMGAAGAARSLGSALLSIVNPTSLIVLGLVGATAATIQWFTKGREGAKTMDDAIKLHSENLKLLKEEYGDLGEAVKGVGSIGGQAFTSAQVRGNQAMLDAMLRDKAGPFLEQLSGTSWTQSLFGNGGGIAGLRDHPGQQGQFAGPVEALIKSAREGKTDLATFNDEVERLFESLLPGSTNPMALRNTADAILLLGDNAFSVTGKFAPFADAINRLKVEAADGAPDVYQFNQEIERIGQTRGLQKLADEAIIAGKEIVDLARQAEELEKILARIDRENTRPGLADLRSFGRYVAVRDATLRSENDQFAAEQQMARARTNAEKLAAIEAQVRARAREDGDKGGGLQARVNRALEAELNRQAIEARDAQVARGLAIDKTLASQQLDLTLIGKTAGEAAKLRMEFEQIAAIREEAAEKGIAADESEIAAIKAKAEAYGKFADEIARANLARELNFERDQQFRSAQDQQIASRQQGAGLAVDLNSPAAQQMRDLARFADAKGLAVGFLTDFKSELLSNGGDVGEALGNAILNALTTSMDKQLSDIFDRLATWIAAALTGQRPGAGVGGGAGFVANTTLSAFLGAGGTASNDNYAKGAVTRAPLPNLTGMAGYIQQAAIARGIDPDTALRVARSEGLAPGVWQSNAMKNGIREPSYGPFQLLKGGAGTGYPAGLGNDFMRQTGLDPANPANARAGVDFALDNAAKNGWGAWYGAKAAGVGNWQGLSGANPIGVGAEKASAALDKMSTNAITASQNLGGLGTSVTSAVDALAGGLGGKGGPASILDGLKPGNFQANTSRSEILGYAGSAPASSGGGGGIFSALLSFIPKLFGFANGTDFAPGGLARINEMGGEIIDLPRGSRVIPHDVSMRMAANSNRPSQPSKVDFNINLDGANGDDHVRMLARQGAQEAISQYHEAQSRGGFGELQRQYASQKG
ncbi:phage tail length tape measure family protein [Mesorhizobium sp.]|uniref:phage tail length tape measure family protein n=3 Tax=unclassified Mesorhizobium TaxID=325217 RepID=UPI00257F9F49|nr:phage tail length tape measure family protein [Mesorhizobium sp.]